MKILKYIVITVLIFTGIQTNAQSVLDEYLGIAAENNPKLKAQFYDYMAALEKVPQAGALPDPQLAFAYFIQPVETRVGPQKAKISVSQMFPWFGTLSHKQTEAELFAKTKYYRFEDAKNRLFYDVKSLYYNLSLINHSIKITEKNIEILRSLESIVKVKLQTNKLSTVDIYRIEMEINDLNNHLAILLDNQSLMILKFQKLLNVDSNFDINLDVDLNSSINLNYMNDLDEIRNNNSLLSSYDYEQEALKNREIVANKSSYPNITLGVDYTFIGDNNLGMNDSGKDAILFPKVGVSLPIYRSKYKAKIQEVFYQQEASSASKQAQVNRLEVLYKEAFNDYFDANRREALYKKQMVLAQKSLEVLKVAYSSNNADFEEILQLQRQLLKYELNEKMALTDRLVSLAFVIYLKGN